jgi:hypothetical protein
MIGPGAGHLLAQGFVASFIGWHCLGPLAVLFTRLCTHVCGASEGAPPPYLLG